MITEHSYDEYDMKLAEWRGYVARGIEEINKELVETNKKIDALDCKIDKYNGRLTGLEVKVASIGGLTGFIVSVLTLILTGAIHL